MSKTGRIASHLCSENAFVWPKEESNKILLLKPVASFIFKINLEYFAFSLWQCGYFWHNYKTVVKLNTLYILLYSIADRLLHFDSFNVTTVCLNTNSDSTFRMMFYYYIRTHILRCRQGFEKPSLYKIFVLADTT